MELRAAPEDAGKRLDQFVQQRMPEYSRSRIQEWNRGGRVLVDGRAEKAAHLLRGGETIAAEPAEAPPLRAAAEDIPLPILYEDADVIAVNKPAGMVVHAGAGVHSGTVVNALLHRFGSLSQAGDDARPGIVHRIDRYTSGVLLAARNDPAHRHLAQQFSKRTIEKTYLTLVHGAVRRDQDRIEKPITRDPVRRTRMTARLGSGREAWTEYRVLERLEKYTYMAVKIGTGRTHQIRVHLASVGHPVAGDTLYGAPASGEGRYFLHAWRIAFTAPGSGERITVTAPLPCELEDWLRRAGATMKANPTCDLP